MAFLVGTSGSNLVNQFGLSNTQFGQGVIGYDEEKKKASMQLTVFIAMFVALVLGIIAVVLLSTGVEQLETFSDYFKSTGHLVGIGFAVATIIALIVTNVLLSNVVECAEKTLERRSASANPYYRPVSPPMPQTPPPQIAPLPLTPPPTIPLSFPPTVPPPPPPSGPSGNVTVPIVQQPQQFTKADAQQLATQAAIAGVQAAAQKLSAQPSYPTVPVTSPTSVTSPTAVETSYPAIPAAAPSLQAQLSSAVSAAAPVAIPVLAKVAIAQTDQRKDAALTPLV